MSLALRSRLVLEVTLHHGPTGRFDQRTRLFLAKQVGESMAHVAMKLLAWLLHHEDGLVVEASAGQHYKPDLLAADAQGRPRLWIDCGSTSIRKLGEIVRRNPDARFVIVKPYPLALRRYAALARTRLGALPQVRFTAFDDGFVDALAARLQTRHRIEATVPETADALYLEVDGAAMHTRVHEAGEG